MDCPGSSAGKESACNAGDPSSIPEAGISAVEGIGYPLQYSWASLVAQLVKNLPAVWETWVLFLAWEDPLEKGMATHISILAWRIPCTEFQWGHKKSDTTERFSHKRYLYIFFMYSSFISCYMANSKLFKFHLLLKASNERKKKVR